MLVSKRCHFCRRFICCLTSGTFGLAICGANSCRIATFVWLSRLNFTSLHASLLLQPFLKLAVDWRLVHGLWHAHLALRNLCAFHVQTLIDPIEQMTFTSLQRHMLNMFTFLTRRVSRELMGKDPWAKAPHAKTLEAVLGGKCPKCDFFCL